MSIVFAKNEYTIHPFVRRLDQMTKVETRDGKGEDRVAQCVKTRFFVQKLNLVKISAKWSILIFVPKLVSFSAIFLSFLAIFLSFSAMFLKFSAILLCFSVS